MAAKQASQVASQSGFNVYSFVSMPAAGQYYAAPSDIYQPNYPIGFVLPTQQFNEVPQTGTIYYQNAPPPYPGKFRRSMIVELSSWIIIVLFSFFTQALYRRTRRSSRPPSLKSTRCRR